jgi:hypothetical protein
LLYSATADLGVAIVLSFASPVFVLSLSLLLHPVAFTARSAEWRLLPPNIQVEANLRPIVVQMLARSRTLRRQCLRIAASPATRVSVAISIAPMEGGARARSFARRYESGLLIVDVRIPPASRDFAELLAHELEHVTELIDGVDFRSLAAARGARVVQKESGGSFESDRARNAGIAAAAEVAASTDGASRRGWRAAARFARAALRR